MKLRIFAITFLMIFTQAFAAGKSTTSPTPKYKFKWVLAHEPVELFIAAAKSFADEVSQQSNGEINVEILTLTEYSKKYKQGKLFSPSEVAQLVRSGEIEMSQTYTTTLGRSFTPLYVLDLPFLFRDHSHATNVLDGKIGKNLLPIKRIF